MRRTVAIVVFLFIVLPVAAIASGALPAGHTSSCWRCMHRWSWLLFQTEQGCCRDSENPDLLDNCVYAGQADPAWQVEERVKACVYEQETGQCTGQECNPFDEAPAASPLLLVLHGAAPDLSGAAHGAVTDMGNGHAVVRTAWPANDNSGWLVLDRNRNGRIDGVREMFSNASRLASGRSAANAYEALAELDDNGDGVLSPADSAWTQLRVWIDRNRNARSEPGELVRLSSLGIKSLSLRAVRDGWQNGRGSSVPLRARMEANGNHLLWSYVVSPDTRDLLPRPWLGRPCGNE
jgi:hypothetical protein